MAIVDRLTIDNGPGGWKSYTDDSYCRPKEEMPQILQKISQIYYESMLKQKIREIEDHTG